MIDDPPSRVSRPSAPARREIVAMLALLVAANVAAWIWGLLAFDRATLVGAALLAYLFGLRHAFDADHIAAIDNVVRKLMQEGRKAYAVGLFFSLGHATIVILASIGVAVATSAMKEPLDRFHAIAGVIGGSVSALFLLLIGLINLLVLRSLWIVFRRVRRGEACAMDDADPLLEGRGLLARACRPLFRAITRAPQMYLVGFLFGLGFDTATEIGLLGISASQAVRGPSAWSILVFPVLFTASMTLMDTLDSVVMTGAYGWAFDNPVRKLRYNLTVTAASVVVALFVGGVEALSLFADKLSLQGPVWSALGRLDERLTGGGFVIVGLLVAAWLVAIVAHRAGHRNEIEVR